MIAIRNCEKFFLYFLINRTSRYNYAATLWKSIGYDIHSAVFIAKCREKRYRLIYPREKILSDIICEVDVVLFRTALLSRLRFRYTRGDVTAC